MTAVVTGSSQCHSCSRPRVARTILHSAVPPAPCALAPALALMLVADQAPPSLPKPLQAQGWCVLDQGMVGVRPLPRQWRGDRMHSLGKGTCWGLMCGEPGLWMEIGQEKGGVCGLLMAADGWEQRRGCFLLSAPAPGIVACTHRQRQGQAAGRSVPAHTPLGRGRAWAKGVRRGSRSRPAPDTWDMVFSLRNDKDSQ